MDLREFVSVALSQIVDGILDAQNYVKDKRAIINPAQNSEGLYIPRFKDRAYFIRDVEFDVAITITSEDKSRGGIGVVASFIGAGLEAETRQADSNVSKIKFSIPVLFPMEERTDQPSS